MQTERSFKAHTILLTVACLGREAHRHLEPKENRRIGFVILMLQNPDDGIN